MKRRILITGCAGFIGFHTALFYLRRGEIVHGIDSLNEYYDPTLKNQRLELLNEYTNFEFSKLDLVDAENLTTLVAKFFPNLIIHLAAQAGVRYSLDDPLTYLDSNIYGTFNLLEVSKNLNLDHFMFASSSSVYGANTKIPYSENDICDQPLSFYAATKKSCELMGHSWAHLHKVPTTALRFFTVYGPWGRPDMALYKFVESITEGREIQIHHKGKMKRDFTYISDVVDAIAQIDHAVKMKRSSATIKSSQHSPFSVFNIGNGKAVPLMKFVSTIETIMNKKAKIVYVNRVDGEVVDTLADLSKIKCETKWSPQVSINEGIENFVKWFIDYKS